MGIITRRLFATVYQRQRRCDPAACQGRRAVPQWVPFVALTRRTRPASLLSHASTDVEATSEPDGDHADQHRGARDPRHLGDLDAVHRVVARFGRGFVLFPTLLVLNAIYQRRAEDPAEPRPGDARRRVQWSAREPSKGRSSSRRLGAEQPRVGPLPSGRCGACVPRHPCQHDASVVRSGARRAAGACIACLLPLGAVRADSGAVTVGTVVSMVTLFTSLVWPVRIIGYLLGEMPRAVVGLDRAERVLAQPPRPPPGHRGPYSSSAAGSRRRSPRPACRTRTSRAATCSTRCRSRRLGRTPRDRGADRLRQVDASCNKLAGLLVPDRGTVQIDGRDIQDPGVDEPARHRGHRAPGAGSLFGDSGDRQHPPRRRRRRRRPHRGRGARRRLRLRGAPAPRVRHGRRRARRHAVRVGSASASLSLARWPATARLLLLDDADVRGRPQHRGDDPSAQAARPPHGHDDDRRRLVSIDHRAARRGALRRRGARGRPGPPRRPHRSPPRLRGARPRLRTSTAPIGASIDRPRGHAP